MSKTKMHGNITQEADQFKLEGCVGFDTVHSIWLKYKKYIKNYSQSVIQLNLQEVRELDSACLALLLAMAKDASKKGKSLQFSHIPAKMLALAKVSGVATVLFL